jgi:hypothetical protein
MTGQMDLTDNYRIHTIATEHTFFSAAHGIFSKINHILQQEASLNKYKKTEITPYILSGLGIKLKINNKTNYRKYSNT